jgi:hypothetical protein
VCPKRFSIAPRRARRVTASIVAMAAAAPDRPAWWA